MDWVPLIITGIKVFFFTFVVILPLIAYSTYAERRVCAIMQDRVGPNRVGIPLTLLGFKKDLSFFGLLQPLADGLKGLFKQDLTPGHVRKSFYWMAPALTAVPAFITVCVIPFGSNVNLFGHDVKLVIADIGAGPLFVFAIASLSVYGITLAGWSSNSKYPFFGGVRSCAQMISYEIALGLSIIPVLMVFGKLNLTDIVTHQSEKGWLLLPLWNEHGSIFSGDYWAHCGPQWLLLLPLGISFIVFTTSIFAETNRMPFDLPECETELVGGYHTEYSSMKFALFFMGEYAAMIVGSAVIVTIFFGGWSLGFGLDSALLQTGEGDWKWFAGFIHLGVFLAKTIGFIIFFIWVRWTVPRLRYDQLMKLGWVVFFELALFNIFIAALIIAAPHIGPLLTLFVGVPILLALAAIMYFITKSVESKHKVNIT
ncbi:MAG: complex I subunit 1 family protein [Akkermansiaceae bacterium]